MTTPYTQNQKTTGFDTLTDVTVANGDLVPVGDISDSGFAKAMTWTSVKAFLKAYFDTLYPSGSGTSTGTNTGNETTTTEGALINGATAKSTPVDADFIGLMDSAASNILKKLSWANVKATLKTYFDTLYASAPTFKSGIITRNIATASGAVTTAHGMSLAPKRIRFSAVVLDNTEDISTSIGVFDSSGQRAVYSIKASTAGHSSTGNDGSNAIYIVTYNGNIASAVVSVDTTNITLTWTKTNTPTGTASIVWEAEP